MRLSTAVAGAAFAVGMAFGTATAAPITGSVGISFGTVTDGGGPLTTVSTLTISGAVFNSTGSGTLQLLAGSSIDTFSVDLSVGTPVEFTGTGGSYFGLVSTVDLAPDGAFANLVAVEGEFTPDPTFESPAGNFPFATLTGNPDTLVRLTFTFLGVGYGGGGAMIAATPTRPDDVPVPEPATLALLGMGLAGLGVAMRRRKADRQPS